MLVAMGRLARLLPVGLGIGLASVLSWPAPAPGAVIVWAAATGTGHPRTKVSVSAPAVKRLGSAPPGGRVLLADGVGLIAGLATLALSWGHFRSHPLLLA